MDSSKTKAIFLLAMIVVLLAIAVAIVAAIVLIIKHLIKFTTRTIYEEKARAEERHRKSYDPEEDR